MLVRYNIYEHRIRQRQGKTTTTTTKVLNTEETVTVKIPRQHINAMNQTPETEKNVKSGPNCA